MRPYMAEASEARGNVVHPGFVTWSLEPLMSTSNFNRSPILQGSRLIQPSIDEKHRVFATDGRQRDAIARYGIPGRVWEAAYLLTRYLDSAVSPHEHKYRHTMREKEARVEYDPPWMPDSPLRLRVDMRDSGKGEKAQEEGAHEESATTLSSFNEGSKVDILIELGAGLGYVGLAAAESMQTLLRNRRLREDDDGGKRISGSNGEPEATHGDTSFSEAEVILTDLPDVCVLLKENAALQMKEWAGRGIEGITSDEDEENIQVVDQKIQGAKGYSILDLKASLVRISVRDLAWGNDEHVQSLSKELQGKYSSRIASGYVNLTILCSDLVYFPSLLAPLLRSLIHLTSPDFLSGSSTQATILMSYRVRSLEKESPFWRAFGTWFDFEPVLTRRISERDPLHNEYGRFASDYDSKKAGGSDKEDKTTNEDGDGDEDGSDCWRRVGWDETGLSFLFRARRKPETLSWICPKDDDKLLYGSRGDDRFEILLMLCSGDATTTMVGF